MCVYVCGYGGKGRDVRVKKIKNGAMSAIFKEILGMPLVRQGSERIGESTEPSQEYGAMC